MAPPPTQANLVPHFSHIGTESILPQGIVHAPSLRPSLQSPFAFRSFSVQERPTRRRKILHRQSALVEPPALQSSPGMPRNEERSSMDAMAPRSPLGTPRALAQTEGPRKSPGVPRGVERYLVQTGGPRSSPSIPRDEASTTRRQSRCAPPVILRSSQGVLASVAGRRSAPGVPRNEASTMIQQGSLGAPREEASTLPLRSALGVLPAVDRRGSPVAQSKSTKEIYSPTTEDNDSEDDDLPHRRFIESSTSHKDGAGYFSMPSLYYPRRSLQLDLKVQPGSDLTTARGKMTAVPLELLETEEPFRPPFTTVSSSSCSSPPALVQARHKSEVFSSCSLPPTASTVLQGSWTRQKGNRSPLRLEAIIELNLVEALRSLQAQPNFREIVSTTNKWGQTLAHLSIFHGYPSLLRSLIDWRIDLTIADANGLTALHHAYMKGDLDSVRILRRGGASEVVMDKLGRTPLDLRPEGYVSVFDLDNDAKVAVGFDSGVPLY